jgi:hypothetical protein
VGRAVGEQGQDTVVGEDHAVVLGALVAKSRMGRLLSLPERY